jgi:hypothetical protein
MLPAMTRTLDNTSASSGDRARNRAFQRDFWPGMVAYLVLLTAVMTFGDLDGHSPWRYVQALVPVLPAAWIVRAVIRHVHRIDDYQRVQLLQGVAVGFAVAMTTAVTVGFLGIAGLSGPLAGWVVYGAGMLGWLVAGAVAQRR